MIAPIDIVTISLFIATTSLAILHCQFRSPYTTICEFLVLLGIIIGSGDRPREFILIAISITCAIFIMLKIVDLARR